MSQAVIVGGQNYTVPDVGERSWGQNVTDLLVAMATQITGGGGSGGINAVPISTTPVNVTSGSTYLVNTTAARTFNLPTPAANAFFAIRDVSGLAATNNITINRAGTEQIDGVAANKILATDLGYWIFVCDGTNWHTLLNYPIKLSQIDGSVGTLNMAGGSIGTPALTIGGASYGFANTGSGIMAIAAGSQICRFDSAGLVIVTGGIAMGTNPITAISRLEVGDGAVGLVSVGNTGDTDTGLYFPADNSAAIATGGSNALVCDTNVTVSKGKLLVPDGTTTSPTLSFASDTDTGFSRPSSGNVMFIVDGATIFTFDGSNSTLPKIARGNSGNTNLVFQSDGIIITCGGQEVVRPTFTASLPQLALTVTTNTASNPVISFIGDLNTGINRPSADRLDLVTAGTTRVYCDSGGLVGIGSSAPTSTLHVVGSFAVPTASFSTDQTLTAGQYTVRMDASGANRTVTLPAASGCAGRIYVIKKIDSSANTVTIDANSTETIDGALTQVLTTQYQSYTIQSNGTNWDIL